MWSFIKSKTKVVQGVHDLYTDNTKTAKSKTDSEKTQILSNFFASVYVSEASNRALPMLNKNKVNCEIDNLIITKSMVQNRLLDLDINKACGPDQMHPHLLKDTASEFCILNVFQGSGRKQMYQLFIKMGITKWHQIIDLSV